MRIPYPSPTPLLTPLGDPLRRGILAAAGLGAIFVPYPHAVDDHQTHNAKVLVQADAAISVPQGEFTAQHLADLLQKLDRPNCLQWAEQARKQALPDAAKLTAQAVISTIAAD